MLKVQLIAVLLCLAVLVVVVVQNSDVVELQFLTWKAPVSLVAVVLVTAGVGFIMGFLLGKLGGRRQSGAAAGLVLILALPAVSSADEPAYDELKRHLKQDWMSVGMLVQVVGDVQADRSLDGENGFSMGAFRASARGNLDGGMSYFVQTNFTGAPALLDARITHRTGPGFGVSVGAMKAPFSAEFLTGAADIDFVNRSRAVAALVPGRQLGLTLDGRLGDSVVHYRAGVFNGNGVRANGNDGGAMGVGRLEVRGAGVQAGVSGAISEDRSVSVGPFSSFHGRRTLFGADLRATRGAWTGSAEVIGAELDPDGGAVEKPWGFHVTGAVATSPRVQLLARLDAMKTDDVWSRYGVAGLNFWPTGPTELQFNVLVPLDEPAKESQLLVNAQINL